MLNAYDPGGDLSNIGGPSYDPLYLLLVLPAFTHLTILAVIPSTL